MDHHTVVARSVESATAEISARPFSADEFERLIEMGVIGEDDRCELINGEIITMAALGSRHIACVNRLVARLVPVVEPLAIVSPQNAIRLDDKTELVPDLVLLRKRADYYESELGKPELPAVTLQVTDLLGTARS